MFKYSISGGPGATGYVCVLWYVSVLNLINYQFFLIFRRRVLCYLLTLIVLFYFFPLIKAAVSIVLLKIQGGGGKSSIPGGNPHTPCCLGHVHILHLCLYGPCYIHLAIHLYN